ncbi:hypothetical protein [Hydrogenophaga sp. BPS33]|uniref:hypothetical protein n=1 Tax=Hydrogenophaga sp. BPS33 TaxID=2651974 RepID=UPI00131FE9F9|nr:hypothetical protein [Hydrogenophaga sp. BPS33]QHE83886.1 hypothetical protein F9K07_02800 [Hydrogenophaga sp. BPS33]
MKPQVITFADFQPGIALGVHVECYTPELAATWTSIFGQQTDDGANGAAEAASVAMALTMRAYLTVASPRPPGNVQVRQRFHLHQLPRLGETVSSVVHCIGKQVKRDRLYVDLQVEGVGDHGRPLFTGVLSVIWAA